MTATDRVLGIVAPLVEARGLDLYDLDHAGGVLKVIVQRPGGVDLDAIAELTRAVSRALDEHDPIPARYTLEVTTPGLERTLRTPTHFAGAVGEQIKVKTVPGAGDDRRVEGVVLASGEEAVTVRTPGGEERTVAFSDIERARTVFEWGPGKDKPTTKTKRKKQP